MCVCVGMVVGPSVLGFIDHFEHVETLSQIGGMCVFVCASRLCAYV